MSTHELRPQVSNQYIERASIALAGELAPSDRYNIEGALKIYRDSLANNAPIEVIDVNCYYLVLALKNYEQSRVSAKPANVGKTGLRGFFKR